MIHEEFVKFETAKLLKEVGFPQDPGKCICKADYSENGAGIKGDVYTCPSQAQAMRWLRECHHLSVRVNFIKAAYKNWFWDMLNTETEDYIDGDYFYLTYEEAAEAGIRAACKHLIP